MIINGMAISINTAERLYWFGRYVQRAETMLKELVNSYDYVIDRDFERLFDLSRLGGNVRRFVVDLQFGRFPVGPFRAMGIAVFAELLAGKLIDLRLRKIREGFAVPDDQDANQTGRFSIIRRGGRFRTRLRRRGIGPALDREPDLGINPFTVGRDLKRARFVQTERDEPVIEDFNVAGRVIHVPLDTVRGDGQPEQAFRGTGEDVGVLLLPGPGNVLGGDNRNHRNGSRLRHRRHRLRLISQNRGN